jgi:hypothetical protein
MAEKLSMMQTDTKKSLIKQLVFIIFVYITAWLKGFKITGRNFFFFCLLQDGDCDSFIAVFSRTLYNDRESNTPLTLLEIS